MNSVEEIVEDVRVHASFGASVVQLLDQGQDVVVLNVLELGISFLQVKAVVETFHSRHTGWVVSAIVFLQNDLL